MANIRLDLDVGIYDGQNLTFKAPCDSTDVTGLIIYYPNSDTTESTVFTFKDAHGNALDTLDLFAEGAYLTVVLDTVNQTCYFKNADTNAYLEGKFESKADITDHRILTYTSLEDIGLTDDVMGATADDVLANMAKINTAVTSGFQLYLATSANLHPNLSASINAKINADTGYGYTTATQSSIFIRRAGNNAMPMLIDVVIDSATYNGYIFSTEFNRTSSVDNMKKFVVSKHQAGYAIPSYNNLAQLGLTNDDMSATDFVANMKLINNAMTAKSEFWFYGGAITASNFANSVLTKLRADLGYNWGTTYPFIRISKINGVNHPILIEVFTDAIAYGNQIVKCIYDETTSGEATFTPKFWVEGVATAIWYPITTLTNGTPYDTTTCGYWTDGKQVTIKMRVASGLSLTLETDTPLFTLPTGFRPSRRCEVPVYARYGNYNAPIKAYVNSAGVVGIWSNITITTVSLLAFEITFFIE